MSSSLPIASTTAATLSDCTSSAIEDHLKQAARLSEQDEIRLNEDASRLTNEAKRHRDEAEEMERQAKRRRTEAEDAGRLRKSLEFEALCLALRRNDASITTLPSADKFPDGYAQPLGNALQNNTHVSSMEIQLKNAVPYIFDDETYSESNVRKFASPLAQYMESTCFRNQNIEALDISPTEKVPSIVFRKYEEVRMSLKTLKIYFDVDNPYSAQERLDIGEAFRFYTSMVSLTITTNDSLLVASILDGLSQSGECKLTDLKLDIDPGGEAPELCSSLAVLLQSATQPVNLHLAYISFTGRNMAVFLSGLQRPDDANDLAAVSGLTFRECNMNSDAQRLFVEFLQTRVGLRGANGRPRMSSLRSVELENNENTTNAFTPENLVSMLCVQEHPSCISGKGAPAQEDPKWYPTIGSCIERVSISPLDTFEGFVPLLAESAPRVRLSSLQATYPSQADVVALTQCIAKISSLRALSVDFFYDGSSRPIIRSLKENDNLQSLSLFDDNLTAADTKYNGEYCERNKHLDGLLAESTTVATEADGEMTPEERATANSKMSHCPTLFQAAMRLPSARASKVMRTLMRFRESIGKSQ